MNPRFSPYPTYKPSGVQWLGDIPAHWEVKRLKFVAPPSHAKLSEKPEDMTYLGLENIESKTGRIILDAQIEIVESNVNAFEEGDVLFGKLRPYLAKVAYSDFRGVCTTEILALHPQHDAFGKFLMYLLLSDGFIGLVDSFTYGAKMPRASSEQIGVVALPLPPLPEQRAIAAFLDRETARLDALIAKKERLIQLLQEKRAALISHAVTRGVQTFEVSKTSKVSYKPSGVEWLGEVPQHWGVFSLKRAAHIRYGLGQPPEGAIDGLPLIRATNLKNGYVTEVGMMYIDPLDVPKSRDAELRAGEILVVRSGAYTGDSALIPQEYDGAIAGYDLVVRIKKGDPKFFAWQLRSEEFRDLQIGFYRLRAAQPHLNAEELGSIVIVFPPLAEQRAIVAHLNRETAKIDALIGKVRAVIEKLQEYRAALIAAAVTGKIQPSPLPLFLRFAQDGL